MTLQKQMQEKLPKFSTESTSHLIFYYGNLDFNRLIFVANYFVYTFVLKPFIQIFIH